MVEHPIIEDINKIPQFKQKSPEWLNQRNGFLTSSDAASALGINPYSSYDELVFKKCGICKPFTGNVATRHGEKYEDEAIEHYCNVMGMVNYEFGLIPYSDVTRENHDHQLDFLAGSPDGIALPCVYNSSTKPVLLEVKCPFRRKPIQGYCPKYYYPQVQLNMLICNLEISDFIEYIPKTKKLYITRIFKNDEWIQNNIPKLIKFWDEVKMYRTQGINTHPDYEKTKARIDKYLKKEKERKPLVVNEYQMESDSD